MYSLSTKENFEEQLNKLKDIKFDILTERTLFAKLTTDILKTFPTIKWMHSLAAGKKKLFAIDSLWNNDNIILTIVMEPIVKEWLKQE